MSHISHFTSPPVSGPLFTDAVRLPAVGGRSVDHHQVLPGEDGGAGRVFLPPHPPRQVGARQAGPGESLPGHTEQASVLHFHWSRSNEAPLLLVAIGASSPMP